MSDNVIRLARSCESVLTEEQQADMYHKMKYGYYINTYNGHYKRLDNEITLTFGFLISLSLFLYIIYFTITRCMENNIIMGAWLFWYALGLWILCIFGMFVFGIILELIVFVFSALIYGKQDFRNKDNSRRKNNE